MLRSVTEVAISVVDVAEESGAVSAGSVTAADRLVFETTLFNGSTPLFFFHSHPAVPRMAILISPTITGRKALVFFAGLVFR